MEIEPVNKTKIFLALSSGVLMGFSCMPKLDWCSWCSWFALVPLFVALENLSSKNVFYLGMLSGFAHYFLTVNWLFFTLQTYSGMHSLQCVFIFLLFLLYLSTYTAVFSIVISYLKNSTYQLLLVSSASWVLLEFLRGVLITGFPWEFIGYTQFKQLKIIQIADLFGIYGVSFILVSFNAFLYISISFLLDKGKKVTHKGIKGSFFFISILLGCTLLYGNWRIDKLESYLSTAKVQRMKVGIVQGNIDQSRKWLPSFQMTTIEKYVTLSQKVKLEEPDLIIWPETATPFFFELNAELRNFLFEAIKDINCDFIIGSPSIQYSLDETEKYFNSAYLVESNGKIKGRYDKSHLVPFGEYFPSKIPGFIFKSDFTKSRSFIPGKSGETLIWKTTCNRLGLQICYEIIFPSLSRLIVQNGAGLIANITNDAWFGDTNAAYQHFSMSVFRAIENRRSLIRVANTGISGFIDPTGKILDTTPVFSDEVMVKDIPVFFFRSIYTELGDFFILICVVIVIIFFTKYYLYHNIVFRILWRKY